MTPEVRELSLGSVAMDIPAAMHQRLKPLAAQLTQELARPVRLRLSVDITKAVDEMTSRAIQAALLRLHPANPEHRKVIAALDEGYDGFVAADDADYNVLRKLIRPFQN